MTLKEAIKSSLVILKQVMEEKLNATNIEVSPPGVRIVPGAAQGLPEAAAADVPALFIIPIWGKLELFPCRGAEFGLFLWLICDGMGRKEFSDLLQSAEPSTPPSLLVLPLHPAILFCLAACNIRRNENYPAPGLLY